jgi:hypothetical protein
MKATGIRRTDFGRTGPPGATRSECFAEPVNRHG